MGAGDHWHPELATGTVFRSGRRRRMVGQRAIFAVDCSFYSALRQGDACAGRLPNFGAMALRERRRSLRLGFPRRKGASRSEGRVALQYLFLVPRSDFEIEDDWHVAGLKGTGTNTILGKDAFIPDHRASSEADTARLRSDPASSNNGPLYRYPWGLMLAYAISAPAQAWLSWCAGGLRRSHHVPSLACSQRLRHGSDFSCHRRPTDALTATLTEIAPGLRFVSRRISCTDFLKSHKVKWFQQTSGDRI